MIKKSLFMGAALLAGTAVYADGVTVEGYVDAGVKLEKTGSAAGKGMVAINEGAVYLSKKVGSGGVMVDLPFKAATASGFGWDASKFQGYVNWNYDNGFGWQLGQFDGLFGLAATDSKDSDLISGGYAGSLFSGMNNGLLVSYGMGDMLTLKAVFDNFEKSKFNHVVFANTKVAGFDLGLGAELGYNKNMAFNVNLKGELAMLMLGVDFGMMMPDVGDSQTGVDVNLGWWMNDMMGFGATYGMLMAAADHMTIAAGPTFKMSKDMKVKLSYAFTQTKTTATTNTQAVAIKAVHSF